MKRCALALLLAALLPFAGLSAHAAPIYRCGQTYSQTPCAGGSAVDAADPRSAAQRAEAQRVTEREKQLASEMERDREDREAALPTRAAGFDSHPVPAAAAPSKPRSRAKHGRRKAAFNEDFSAIAPAPDKTARR